MLKKALSLLVVLVMSLTAFGSLVSAAATAAPEAPADVEGATYLLKETFTSLPASGSTGTTGTTSYTWQTNSNSSYDSTYNALAQKAVVKADFADITAAGDYVMSVDFMTPTPALGNGDVRIQLDGSLRLVQVLADGKLYIGGNKIADSVEADHWYRLTANITLPGGDVVATVTDLTNNNEVVGTKNLTGLTSITQFNINFTKVTTNPFYTQNWQLYKKGAETGGDSGEEGGETPTATPAPNAPADVENATYLLKETFNATLANNSTGTTGTTTYTWTTTDNRNAYDSTYNALNQDKALKATFSSPITDNGNYVFTMDFMLTNTNLSGDYKVYLFDSYKIMQLSKANGILYLCQADTGKKMTDLATEKWYRLNVKVSLPSKDVTATLTEATTGVEIASKSANNSNATQIKHINIDGAGLYTQNWRLYKEYQKEYHVAPSAPADVQGAQYIIKNDFAAVPHGTDAYNGNLTWTKGGNLNYNADYKALNHAAYVQGNFSNAVTTPGKYKFTLNFLVDEPTTLTDAYNLQIDDFYVMSIAASTGKISLGGEETSAVVLDEKWYTLEAIMSVPDGIVDIRVLDASDNSVVCSKNFSGIENFNDGISKIRLSNARTAQTNLYTQSWRLYKLANNFIAEFDGSTIKASYILETERNVIIAIALYEGDMMKDVSCETYKARTGLVSADIDYIAGCTVKAFLWDADTLAPLFESIQDNDIRK